MNTVGFDKVVLTGGFWQKKQTMNRETTIWSVYKQFSQTGRFDSLRFDWKEGMPNRPHHFWDSDVAKWVEAAAYLLMLEPNAELEAIIDETVENIANNQDANGYFNTYFTLIEPTERFRRRDMHELYCAGHLLEAAIAYYQATGKDKFLNCMKRYIDHIEQVFVVEQSAAFTTPGHEEIELALIRMYDLTGEERYLRLAEFFINARGNNEKDGTSLANTYEQAHLPVREQHTAEGHAVRATYLYSAMADLAVLRKDELLAQACRDLFDNITRRRMYITGGIGSDATFEAFTGDYDLPNVTAYTETCAAIGLIFFASRMQKLRLDSRDADLLEWVLYNGFLSGISLDGNAFFYENPLEIPALATKEVGGKRYPAIRYPIDQRVEVFACSCCPPNISRVLASLGQYVYTYDEDTIYCHQFMESTAQFACGCGEVKIQQKTAYPYDGKVSILYNGPATRLAVRIPAWCDAYPERETNGYMYYDVEDGTELNFDFPMTAKLIAADPRLVEDYGRCAVSYGPLLYCAEEVDNGSWLHSLSLCPEGEITRAMDETLGLPVLTMPAIRRPVEEDAPLYLRYHPGKEDTVRLIPYHAFANRGRSEMIVWLNTK